MVPFNALTSLQVIKQTQQTVNNILKMPSENFQQKFFAKIVFFVFAFHSFFRIVHAATGRLLCFSRHFVVMRNERVKDLSIERTNVIKS